MNRVLMRLVALGASAFAALVVGEVVVRTSGLAIGARTEPVSPYGPRYLPGSPFVLEEEHRNAGRMNNVGFHDRPLDLELPPSIRRVGFFGDSVTEARQVEVDSTFVNVFEDRANAEGAAIDAASFGLIGSGADQSFFRCLHALQQARFDEVVYVFCRNDFLDGAVENEKPLTWPFVKNTERGALYFSGAYQHDRQRPEIAKELLKELYLPGFVSYRMAQWQTMRRVRTGWTPQAADDRVLELFAFGDSVPDAQRPALEHWKEVVRRWKRVCDASGVTFRVLYTPVPTEVEDSTYAAVRTEGIPRRGIATWLRAFCEQEGIPFWDPTDALVGAQIGPGRESYWAHFNYKGHRIVGEFLSAAWMSERTASSGDRSVPQHGRRDPL